MANLLEIKEDMRALDQLLDEQDGDVTGMEQIIDKWAADLENSLEEKVDNYAALITEKMKMYAVRQGEAERLTRLALTDKNRADWLKARLKYMLDEMCIKKLETTRYRISVAGNGGKQKLDIFVPDDELPEEYLQTIPSVRIANNVAIREALEAGKKIDGVVLQERGTSLRIR
jgi:hypothetical protein